MEKHKVEVDIQDFPNELREYLENAIIYDSSSCSSAKVYYLDTGYYLKMDEAGKLEMEVELTKWFYAKKMGVEVITYLSLGKDYMLMKEVEGEDGLAFLDNPKELCKELAKTMRKLHNAKYDDFPYSSRMERYIASAQSGYHKGYFDERVLLPRFKIDSKEEAWEIIQANKHRLQKNTLIHGDMCLPNVIFKEGKFHCFIDVATDGIGDKHIDLYWAIWSLWYNLKTDAYTDYFLDLYGRENFEYDMLKVIAAFEVFG